MANGMYFIMMDLKAVNSKICMSAHKTNSEQQSIKLTHI